MPGMRACHPFTLGEGKMRPIRDMADSPDFYLSAATSAIPGKAEQVQLPVHGRSVRCHPCGTVVHQIKE